VIVGDYSIDSTLATMAYAIEAKGNNGGQDAYAAAPPTRPSITTRSRRCSIDHGAALASTNPDRRSWTGRGASLLWIVFHHERRQ
jgi:hypothetical protein